MEGRSNEAALTSALSKASLKEVTVARFSSPDIRKRADWLLNFDPGQIPTCPLKVSSAARKFRNSKNG